MQGEPRAKASARDLSAALRVLRGEPPSPSVSAEAVQIPERGEAEAAALATPRLPQTRRRLGPILAALTGGLIVALVAGICVGSVRIPADVVAGIIGHRIGGDAWVSPSWTYTQDVIVADTRLPRVLLAAVVGASLTVVGMMIQAAVRNPLAGPGLLGVSAGSATGAVLILRFGMGAGLIALHAAAFVGALAAVGVVLLIARPRGETDPTRLVLAGMAVSTVLTAIDNLLILTSPDQTLAGQVLQWTLGGFGAAKWSSLALPALTLGLLAVVLLPLARRLDIILLGDEAATALGVDAARFRVLAIVLAAFVTAVMTAAAGVIGFVGLMMPHVVRMLVGAGHRRGIPVAVLAGAVFTVLADLIARTVAIPLELPVGIITALVGGPYFVWLLGRQRRGGVA